MFAREVNASYGELRHEQTEADVHKYTTDNCDNWKYYLNVRKNSVMADKIYWNESFSNLGVNLKLIQKPFNFFNYELF